MDKLPSIDHILEVGLGFAASQTLLSAVELGVFSELAQGARTAEALAASLNLHPRRARDFFDALVALKLLDRHDGVYSNSAAAHYYLDRKKPTYAGGSL